MLRTRLLLLDVFDPRVLARAIVGDQLVETRLDLLNGRLVPIGFRVYS